MLFLFLSLLGLKVNIKIHEVLKELDIAVNF